MVGEEVRGNEASVHAVSATGVVFECEVAFELLSRVGGWESVAERSGRRALTGVDGPTSMPIENLERKVSIFTKTSMEIYD